MIKQKLIIKKNLSEFQKEIQEQIQDGWLMVPSSLNAAIASASNNYGNITEHLFAVILEKHEN